MFNENTKGLYGYSTLEFSLHPRGNNCYPCFCTAYLLFHYYNIMNPSIIFSQTMVYKALCTFFLPFESNQNEKMVTKNAGYNMRLWDPNSAKYIEVTHHAWESPQQTSKESGPKICLSSFFFCCFHLNQSFVYYIPRMSIMIRHMCWSWATEILMMLWLLAVYELFRNILEVIYAWWTSNIGLVH